MKSKLCVVFFLVVFIVFGGAASAFAAQIYHIDKAHSSIGFSIAHLMVSRTTGVFADYTGDVRFSADDLEGSVFDFTVKAAGIDTGNKMRDEHLRGPDFFDVEKYPDIVFKSRKVESASGNAWLVTGDLSMKAVTREIQVPVTIQGPVVNPVGQGSIIGIQARFQINRQDYGVSWNKVMDNGGLIVGDIVDLDVNIEAHSMP